MFWCEFIDLVNLVEGGGWGRCFMVDLLLGMSRLLLLNLEDSEESLLVCFKGLVGNGGLWLWIVLFF